MPNSMLTPEHVLLASAARSKRALITELAQTLTAMDLDQVMEVVMAREQLGSTGIGHGVAIPHGRLPELSQPVVAIARHPGGVDFDAIDGHPVHIIVMLLVPEESSRQHLELLAYLARIFQQEELRNAVMRAHNVDEILDLFPDLTSG